MFSGQKLQSQTWKLQHNPAGHVDATSAQPQGQGIDMEKPPPVLM